MSIHATVLESYLADQDDAAWQRAAGGLQAETHEVDRSAAAIWLAFFPIALARLLAGPHDRAALEGQWLLQGRYRLADQIDTSHAFLYGHRYWPHVKQAIVARAAREAGPLAGPLAALAREVSDDAASAAGVDRVLVTGIAIVGLSTLQQVGLDAFGATPGTVTLTPDQQRRTPDQVVRERARDDRQGLMGLLRGEQGSRWTVRFDERDAEAAFTLIHTQAITTAAAADPRDWRRRDPRCTEGPIPVQCRSASCGTCWVGVLGGSEKLSPVEPRERAKLRECGYGEGRDDPHPVIRLACQARATGAVSIVIPPWNGIIGKAVAAGPSANMPAGAR
jgi:ferredoxin